MIHEVVFEAAVVWLTVMAGICVGLAVAARAAAVRILLVDLVTIILASALILRSAAEGVSHYVDAALVLALLSFAATLAAARFLGRGKVLG